MEIGNTESPLFKLCQLRISAVPNPDENVLSLPDWIKKFVFKETTDEEFPFRVITIRLLIKVPPPFLGNTFRA